MFADALGDVQHPLLKFFGILDAMPLAVASLDDPWRCLPCSKVQDRPDELARSHAGQDLRARDLVQFSVMTCW